VMVLVLTTGELWSMIWSKLTKLSVCLFLDIRTVCAVNSTLACMMVMRVDVHTHCDWSNDSRLGSM